MDIERLPQVVEALAWLLDFQIARARGDHSWICLAPPMNFTVIAGESTGGAFLAYGDGAIETLPVLFATSEGRAGRIAANLTELLAMMLALPYWQDLLKFSGNGSLDEMRRAAQFLEADHEDDYDGLTRPDIIEALSLPVIPDPVKLLHDTVHASDCTLVADDGWHYDSLFNSFRWSDNPFWR